MTEIELYKKVAGFLKDDGYTVLMREELGHKDIIFYKDQNSMMGTMFISYYFEQLIFNPMFRYSKHIGSRDNLYEIYIDRCTKESVLAAAKGCVEFKIIPITLEQAKNGYYDMYEL